MQGDLDKRVMELPRELSLLHSITPDDSRLRSGERRKVQSYIDHYSNKSAVFSSVTLYISSRHIDRTFLGASSPPAVTISLLNLPR